MPTSGVMQQVIDLSYQFSKRPPHQRNTRVTRMREPAKADVIPKKKKYFCGLRLGLVGVRAIRYIYYLFTLVRFPTR